MNGQRRIYLDTSVMSALFDKRTPERQALTEEFWVRLAIYEPAISDTVFMEMRDAPVDLSEKMMAAVKNFTVLPVGDKVQELAAVYMEQRVFPAGSHNDARHVAVAALNEIGVLVSWNFKHLVRLKTRRMVEAVNAMHNHIPVEIVSPPEL